MEVEIAVVGTGPTGLVTALAVSHMGASVALIGPPPSNSQPSQDTRTAALLDSSVAMLKVLAVWERLLAHAAPLKAIRIIDGSRAVWRSPEVLFEAAELGLEAFGYNIPNGVLVRALYERAGHALAGLFPSPAERIEIDAGRARLVLADGTDVKARLIVGADGRNSLCRRTAGIEASERPPDQAALAASFEHQRPHAGVSNEIHQAGGSLTTVPLLAPSQSSLIWVGKPGDIAELMRLDEGQFAQRLAERMESLLGRIAAIGPRASFSVTPLSTPRMAARRIALVGEAAHILHPIGAQGLNLGFRDAATLADCVREGQAQGDPGAGTVLEAYDRARRFDVLSRTVGIDLLNRSLLSGFLPLQVARGIVSYGLNAVPDLRRFLMRVGMEPPTDLPSLMRPERGAA
jgi:2-octaprenyl-6-methoxyphenol hydroxylase